MQSLAQSRLTLYANDGGFRDCDVVPDWCDSHVGDAQSLTIHLRTTSLTTAKVTDVEGLNELPHDECEVGDLSFEGTHVVVYPSAGNHHGYCKTVVCPAGDDSTCTYGDQTGDRANGLGTWVTGSTAGSLSRATPMSSNCRAVTSTRLSMDPIAPL